MLTKDPRLLTVRKDKDGNYQVYTWQANIFWLPNDVGGREELHSLLANAGYKRVRTYDEDPLSGDYRRFS
jgi:hypothetical protein